MAVDPLSVPTVEALSERELKALTQAATWYASYHAHMIAESADDPAAAAVARRERYVDLHQALWKLGIRRALPDALRR
jgi:hypothetical protein